jgi:hypothetical protein
MDLTRREILALAAIAIGCAALPELPAFEARAVEPPARHDDDEVWISGVAGACSGLVEPRVSERRGARSSLGPGGRAPHGAARSRP